MRQFLLFLLVCCSTLALAQERLLSVSVAGLTRKEAVLKIESQSPLRFYFDDKWLDADTTRLTGDYNQKTLPEILEGIFQNSTLNFFIDGNKVILTQNSSIRDRLPEHFFGRSTTSDSIQKPVFRQQFESEESPSGSNNVAFIGRENQNASTKSYSLSGTARDPKTGEPIPNVNIRVKGKKISTVTDAAGNYTLRLPAGMNVIEAESVAHRKMSRNIVVYSDGKLDLQVEEKVNQLQEVNVRSKKNQALRTAVTGVTTLEAEGIKNIPVVFGERDILRVAVSIPGIKTAGEGSAGFNVRGGKEDQNLFLLDHALLYNPSHFFGFFSALNPYTTKKVDIYKGSIPAEFGGRLSSVFDISTKNGDFDKLTGEGGIGPVTGNLSVSTPIVKEKSSLLLGGRATYSNWILKQLDDPQLKDSQASFYDGIVKYTHKINDRNTVEATGYYSRDAFSITSDSLNKYSNRLVSLKWEHGFNDKHRGALIATNSDYRFGINYDNEGPESFDFDYGINETQLQFKMQYQWNNKHRISYGLASKYYSISPGNMDPLQAGSPLLPVRIQKEHALESAVYIADSYKVNDKLLVDVGLRYSFYGALGPSQQRTYQNGLPKTDATVTGTQNYGSNAPIKWYGGFEPRVAARYFLTEDFSVKAGYDRTYQYLHLLSNNTTQSPTDTWKLSDLNVKPQNAQQFSLGFFKNLKDDMYEVSLESYFKTSKNILDYKVGAQLLLNPNVETELLQGEGKAYGIEFLIKKQLGRLNGWIGYTYSRALLKLDSNFAQEVVNNGKYFAANYDKPHDVSLVLNYRFTKRYSLSSNFVYQTGRPITYPIGKYSFGNAEYVLYSDRNAFRIPDYYRVDIGINIEGNHKIKKLAHSFWNISVYNVLGRNNPYSVFFVTKDGQVKAYQTSIFAMPIPTITYNFKF